MAIAKWIINRRLHYAFEPF